MQRQASAPASRSAETPTLSTKPARAWRPSCNRPCQRLSRCPQRARSRTGSSRSSTTVCSTRRSQSMKPMMHWAVRPCRRSGHPAQVCRSSWVSTALRSAQGCGPGGSDSSGQRAARRSPASRARRPAGAPAPRPRSWPHCRCRIPCAENTRVRPAQRPRASDAARSARFALDAARDHQRRGRWPPAPAAILPPASRRWPPEPPARCRRAAAAVSGAPCTACAHRGLQSRETELEARPIEHRARELVPPGAPVAGQLRELRAARVGQTQQLRGLVESLAGRIVAASAPSTR